MLVRSFIVALVLVLSLGAGGAATAQDTAMPESDAMNKIMSGIMNMMTDPRMMESMMKFEDPAIYNQWIGMMTDPGMIDGMMQMMDPAMFTQWLNMMSDPALVEGMTQFADVEMMNQWVDAMTAPEMMDSMMKMMSPEMMRGLMDSMSGLLQGMEGIAEPAAE